MKKIEIELTDNQITEIVRQELMEALDGKIILNLLGDEEEFDQYLAVFETLCYHSTPTEIEEVTKKYIEEQGFESRIN
jgi:hypothetical protein